jgi:hypothetical protein
VAAAQVHRAAAHHHHAADIVAALDGNHRSASVASRDGPGEARASRPDDDDVGFAIPAEVAAALALLRLGLLDAHADAGGGHGADGDAEESSAAWRAGFVGAGSGRRLAVTHLVPPTTLGARIRVARTTEVRSEPFVAQVDGVSFAGAGLGCGDAMLGDKVGVDATTVGTDGGAKLEGAMTMRRWSLVAGLAATGLMLFSNAALAQAQGGIEVQGPVTAVNDGMINGFTHCPVRTVTLEDVTVVWACGGPLPEIGSVWRVVYFESYPSGATKVSRQRTPVNN